MEKSQIESELIDVMSNKLRTEVTSMNQSLHSDLGLGSLDLYDLSYELEKKFNIEEISSFEIQDWHTVSDVVVTLEKYV